MSRQNLLVVLLLCSSSTRGQSVTGGIFLPPLQGTPGFAQTPTTGTSGFPQTVPAATPAQYVCVPIGTSCPTSNTIDIRIVTPNSPVNPCPAGQMPCYGQTPTSACGTQTVVASSPSDPFAANGEFPWQAFLSNQTNFYAGSGVLIDTNNVLTAAHKVYNNRLTPGNVRVILGVYDPFQQTNVQTRTASVIFVHPSYNPTTLFNDIAIIRLSAPVVSQSNINTACLGTQGQSFIGQNCVVSGWGQTGFTILDAPSRKKKVTVPIVPYSTCFSSMSAASILGTNTNTFLDPVGEICAGGVSMMDACSQDGGAPLVCSVNGRYTVAGLVIWGKGCGQAGVYGVYVSVPNYRTWIDQTISQLNG